VPSFDLLDWFTVAAAAWFIYHGAVGVWRRELGMFGHLAGRAAQGTVRGRWAVVAGLAWIAVGVAVLYSRFARVV
jgi:hypothetical protein